MSSPSAASTAVPTGVSSVLSGRAARRDQFGNSKVVDAVRAGIGWLLSHQDDDGMWDPAKFQKHDPQDDPCSGPGGPQYATGITALALLAVLAQGDPIHAEPANKAADWLVRALDKQGRVSVAAHDFFYNQVLTTLALVEMTALHGNPRHRAAAEAGLRYIGQHRNPTTGWRYQPRDTDSDTSLAAWCFSVHAAALHAGLAVPTEGVGITLAWLDTATDSATGHCGYTRRYEPSARMPGEHSTRFPVEKGLAMTAAALHGRLLLGLAPEAPLAQAAAELLATKPPVWEPAAIDTYYWFHASAALALMPNCAASKKWEAALHKALLGSQGKDKSRKGSWDAVDVWGEPGGRVATTAFAVLALSSPWRLDRLDASAQVIDQPPLRKLHGLVRADKLGEASSELARLDPTTIPAPMASGLARLRWLLDVALVHGNRQLDEADKVEPLLVDRLAMIDGIRARFAGLPLADKAESIGKRLREDPKTQKELAAQKDLRPLQKAFRAWREQPTSGKQQQLRGDLQKFLAKYPGTSAATLAQQLLDQL